MASNVKVDSAARQETETWLLAAPNVMHRPKDGTDEIG